MASVDHLPENNSPPAGELLTAWAQRHCEEAFRQLVARYSGLVYGTAMRATAGRRDLAPDIAQRVFVDLARKASSLVRDERLGLWLHRRTRWAAADALKSERRRQQRETESAMEQTQTHASHDPHAPRWEDWAPELDAALARLSKSDRHAIHLRFLEGRKFAAVGAALGVSEDSARKRVSRALEKLRTVLTRRGVVLSASGLLGALSAESANAAPAGTASAWATTAVAWRLTGIAALASRWAVPSGSAALGAAIALGVTLPVLAVWREPVRETSMEGTSAQPPTSSGVVGGSASGPVSIAAARVPEDRLGLEAFVEAMAALYEQPPGPLRDARQRMLLARLSPGLGLEVGEALLARIDRTQLDQLVRPICHYWGTQNVPVGEMFHFLATRWPPGMQHSNRLGFYGKQWAASDADGATRWLEAAEKSGALLAATGTHGYRRVRGELFEGIAQSHGKEHGRSAERRFLIDAMNRGWIDDMPFSFGLGDFETRKETFDLLGGIASPELRRQSRGKLARQAEFSEPGAGRELVDSLSSREARATLAFRMTHELFNGNVARSENGNLILYEGDWGDLLDWTSDHLLPSRRTYERSALLGRWLAKGNLAAAIAWLEQHPGMLAAEHRARLRKAVDSRKTPLSAEESEALRRLGIPTDEEAGG